MPDLAAWVVIGSTSGVSIQSHCTNREHERLHSLVSHLVSTVFSTICGKICEEEMNLISGVEQEAWLMWLSTFKALFIALPFLFMFFFHCEVVSDVFFHVPEGYYFINLNLSSSH